MNENKDIIDIPVQPEERDTIEIPIQTEEKDTKEVPVQPEEKDTKDLPILKKEKEEQCWFAMRATYRSEMSMRDKLKAAGFDCFVPLVKELRTVGRRKKYVWVPAINNLIFVFGKKSAIQEFKLHQDRLQYMCKPTKEGRTPIIVPKDQMDAFQLLYANCGYEITEIDENFKPGTRVRVIDGPFAGMTGTFQRINGHRERRFVVTLDSVLLISTTEVGPGMLEELDSPSPALPREGD